MSDSFENRTEVYLDHAAAMPVDPDILHRLNRYFGKYFANQESAGALGIESARALKSAENILKDAVLPRKRNDYSVLWCQSGTESINAAIQLIRLYHPEGGVILYSPGEHASVKGCLQNHTDPRYQNLPVSLKANGLLDLDDFEKKLSSGKRIIGCIVHFVQSETGVVQDLLSIGRLLRQYHPHALFFSDTIQGIGKIPFPGDSAAVDMFSVSGQKLGVPAGAALICRNSLQKVMQDLRSKHHAVGRLPVPFALIMAEQLNDLIKNQSEQLQQTEHLKEFLLQQLQEYIPDRFQITVPDSPCSPYILHLLMCSRKICFQGAIVVRSLSAKGVSIASGSACDSETKEPSAVLRAMGIPYETAYTAIRISLGFHSRESEITDFVQKLKKTLEEY